MPDMKETWENLKDAAREEGHFADSESSCRLCACLGEMEKAVNAANGL